MGFTKLSEEIVFSSIASEDDSVFKIFTLLMATCKSDGISRVSPAFLANITKKSLEEVQRCLTQLESPDPLSRSTNDEGRRIRRVDGGFYLINYHKYRDFTYSDNPDAKRKRDQRKVGQSGTRPDKVGHSAYVLMSSSSLKEEEVQEEEINQRNIIPPKIEWVEAYCKERENNIDPQTFYDHYQARDWKPKGYTQRMKDWQAAIRTWERNDKKPDTTNFLSGGNGGY